MSRIARRVLLAVAAVSVVGCGGAGADTKVSSEQPSPTPRRSDHPPPAASGAVDWGEALLEKGDVEGASRAFEEALKANPRDARAHFDLGLTHELRNDARSAEASYRRAIEAAPEFAEAHNNLGLVLRDAEKPGEASAMFERAVALRPDYFDAQLNLALTLEAQGDLARAKTAYEAAVRLAPKDAQANVNLGLLLLKLGEPAAARPVLERALPLARGDVASLAAVGNGLRRAGNATLAVRAMEDAIAAKEGEPTPALLSELALAQNAASDRASAVATLERALRIDERYATAHYLLGSILAAGGDGAAATRHFQRYLALEPRGPHAEQARERLKQTQKMRRRPR